MKLLPHPTENNKAIAYYKGQKLYFQCRQDGLHTVVMLTKNPDPTISAELSEAFKQPYTDKKGQRKWYKITFEELDRL